MNLQFYVSVFLCLKFRKDLFGKLFLILSQLIHVKVVLVEVRGERTLCFLLDNFICIELPNPRMKLDLLDPCICS